MATPTLDDVLAMTAEDVPDLATEVATLLRFRAAHAVYMAQQARTDTLATRVQVHNATRRKGQRMGYGAA